MTKEYKLGDTIYVKGTVGQIDEIDPEKPYGIKFVDWDYGTPAWPNRSAIIDELPTAEPVKPVLPKEVGEELDIAKIELPVISGGEKGVVERYLHTPTTLFTEEQVLQILHAALFDKEKVKGVNKLEEEK